MMKTDQKQKIVNSFKARSETYFRDNYELDKNILRQNRYRLINCKLKALLQPGWNVLDCGAGPAVFAKMIKERSVQYFASDISSHNLHQGMLREGNLNCVAADTEMLPFQNGSFHLVLSIGSLEYIPGLQNALAEIVRITKPGGLIIATFANKHSPSRWWNEKIVIPLSMLKKQLKNGNTNAYSRYLQSCRQIETMFNQRGAEIRERVFYNQGLLGYPVSNIKIVEDYLEKLSQENRLINRLNSEFLIIARKK